ncbi:MAG: hypothetical protein ACSLE7_05265 [Mycobacterium sp.]|jgi:hypothetical protein
MEPAPGSAASTTVAARVRKWFSGWGLKEWRRAALVTVLVGTAAFGGLDTVDKQVTELKVGEMFDTGRFELTVQRATVVKELRAGQRRIYGEKPGRSYLGLVVTVRNTSVLPGAMFRTVNLVDQPDAMALPAMRLADGTMTVLLNPGLTDQIVLLWDVPDTAISVGTELQVRISKEVRKLQATVGQGWVQSTTDYGRLAVPVGGPR